MNSHIQVYLHLVWGTWNRDEIILPSFERELWGELRNLVEKQGCRLLALGGTGNHVHLLVQFNATQTIADFVQILKGGSSIWVNEKVRPNLFFKWQGAYGAFSVGHREVPEIIGYIKKQKQHHANGTTTVGYETTNN
ncbi:IS200/IS605 family transposase [bacterium]|nr:MAG: IS200/IS605 family transposase [bacterium]